ncbi:TonB-dependent receptor [Lutibacter sp. A80]|uniref:TonB-dependent receptor domain-containing protein n=1 Tax=Lutibacter sp. A80 TaxID=2918453 RepID=UPI001F06C34B|nr:TonB-dependent receptor [Lutibacter sp. A80]UMB59289.1 TonB-dependent receptor [Lutibacter sp. A80]
MKKLLSVFLVLFIGTSLVAQTAIPGSVIEAKTGQPIPGANIKVVGKSIGTTTDFDGNFLLNTTQNPPFSLEVSLIGYTTAKVEITKNDQKITISLEESATALDEVVVSASRTPERILESPVTIERMDIREIKNTSSPSFYDGLENLKGVDINTNSLTNKSVNTRGFATFSNTRFMQLVDGMDNSSPALNFALGNLLGLSELDVNSVELLPGASSALYGANAFNGILFMTSKNPFDSPGISVYVKTGITSQKAAGDNRFFDGGIRMAYKFSDKFAAKASFSFLKGTDWYATDYRDYDHENSVTGAATPIIEETGQTSFDRMNVYGDEVSLASAGLGDLNSFGQYLESIGALPVGSSALLPQDNVSRTGYKEVDLTDYKARSIKTNISLHYRPFADDLEVIYNAKFGHGNTIYQGTNRYNINNFFMQQHKLEIKNDHFFVRGYLTSEDGGDSYDLKLAGVNLTKQTAGEWFGAYTGAYLQGVMAGASSDIAHAQAREFADANITVQPGTPEFKKALGEIVIDPDFLTGAKFKDNTKLYHVDANYNFQGLIDFADIQVGGSLRQYALNSGGTIFTDADGPIRYNEYGAYTQIQKKYLDDRLKFTGSLRYDKAKNFDGNVSPRVSMSYALGEGKTRNLRASFQTGFRNPTTQDLYTGLDAGVGLIVGSAIDNLDRYTSSPIQINSAIGQAVVGATTVQLSGARAYDNAFSESSLINFATAVQIAIAAGATPEQAAGLNAGLIEQSSVEYVQPEHVTAFEVGYRAAFGKFSIDASAYYNVFEDFIGNKNVAVPLYGDVTAFDAANVATDQNTQLLLEAIGSGDLQGFQTYTNSTADISSYGGSIGLTSRVYGNYDLGLNYTYAKFDFDQSSDPDYEAGFNTPEHKVKLSIGNTEVIKNLGFNLNIRWSDEYLWQSVIADAIIEERTVIDAQVNYTVDKWKSNFKIGAANLGGKEYFSAPGNGKIGSQYFVSWTINP